MKKRIHPATILISLMMMGLMTGNSIARYYQLTPVQELVRTLRGGRRQREDSTFKYLTNE